ncbi:MAG: nucleotide sugar dehydrogenase [Ignavibacteriales bacterium]
MEARVSAVRDHVAALKEKIVTRNAVVAVVGAGYVGLPLAVEKAKVGFSVWCIDRNEKRVAQINGGENYILDVKSEELAEVVGQGRLKASTDFAVLDQCDVVIICVPTPLTVNREPDLQYIVYVSDRISEHLHEGMLVSLESTTYPGTTEEIILPRLEKTGLKVGRDLFLAFSPERVDPGNAGYTTKNTNKLVSGVTASCLDVASTFYGQTILKVVPVSSPAVAEMAKVFENTYRAVNIALVNEMCLLCDRMGLSVWDVLDAAFTKPFGIQPFYPGPGVGGHCIPLDPSYLSWKAREYDFSTRFIELAIEINTRMPYFVVEKIARILGEDRKSINGSNVLVLGVTYKRDLPDARESPALRIIQLLMKDGALVRYHDPFIPQVRIARTSNGDQRAGEPVQMESVELTQEALAEADVVVIATDHSCFDYRWVVDHSSRLVDTRGVTRTLGGLPSHVWRL